MSDKHIIIMDQGYQKSFDDLKDDAEELAKAKNLAVRFEYAGYFFTVKLMP